MEIIIAHALMAVGNWDQAVEFLLPLPPTLELAICYLNQDLYKKALEILDDLTTTAEVFNVYGCVFAELRRYDEAREYWEIARDLADPDLCAIVDFNLSKIS